MSRSYDRYKTVLLRHLPFLLLFSFFLSAGAYFWAYRAGNDYQAHFSYLISLAERENYGEYRFDGYYALQATDLFTATFATWLTTPEVISASYRAADLTPKVLRLSDLKKIVTAAKTGPQLIEVMVTADSAAHAQLLQAGLEQVIQIRLQKYQADSSPALTFIATKTDGWITKREVAGIPLVVAVFFGSLMLSINGLLLLTSFKNMDAY